MQEDVYDRLHHYFYKNRAAHVHYGDGWQGLQALLPPKQLKRGLILIDPPYEDPKEFDVILTHLQSLEKRWNNATIMIWYPIKERSGIDHFIKRISRLDFNRIEMLELKTRPDDHSGQLNGTGLVVINAPWQWDVALPKNLKQLPELLNLDKKIAAVILKKIKEK